MADVSSRSRSSSITQILGEHLDKTRAAGLIVVLSVLLYRLVFYHMSDPLNTIDNRILSFFNSYSVHLPKFNFKYFIDSCVHILNTLNKVCSQNDMPVSISVSVSVSVSMDVWYNQCQYPVLVSVSVSESVCEKNPPRCNAHQRRVQLHLGKLDI